MSSLQIGIVGLPNVGKSTLFNALTDNDILAANYPFATIEPNTGIVPVPDERLQKLSEMYKNAPIKPATVDFVDIAGLVSGASKGEGLGNQFLSHIRSCDAILQVVRGFESGNVVRSDYSKDPTHDIDVIKTELMLADISTLDNRRSKLEKEAKSNPKLKPELELLDEARATLNEGTPLYASPIIERQTSTFKQLQLMTAKPILYLFNIDDDKLADDAYKNELAELVSPAPSLFVSARLEDELRGLDPGERAEFLESFGQKESGLIKVIHAAYDLLGLQSYLTAGEKEVRSWTIPKNATAPQAAGVIHGDFEKGFIAADIVSFPDLMEEGSWAAARSSGKIRTEGKNYLMQPEDIVDFKFNN
ncbi:MAG: redox-regulated ATPase YchF [Candidatus Saccharibacteria bacterium]|nr:redox-regulated ATPase YchF [Candidatus Saccharibacteria bacterium]